MPTPRCVARVVVCLVITLLLAGLPDAAWAQGAPADVQNGCAVDRVLQLTTPPLSGSDVTELQTRLHELGFYNGLIDGVYGPKTTAAVIAFQKSEFAAATGQVTASTWDQLAEGVVLPSATTPPPPSGTVSLIVDTNTLRLTVLVNGEPYKTFPVAVGRGGQLKTPVGDFKIIRKDKDWGGGFGTRWLGLNVPEGIYGIHGTNKPYSIGTRASHGCIRMFNHNVETLYEWVSVGTPVTIIGPLADIPLRDDLHEGTSGVDVRNVQFKLRELGFEPETADGRFGPATTTALMRLQTLYGLPADGRTSSDVYRILEMEG